MRIFKKSRVIIVQKKNAQFFLLFTLVFILTVFIINFFTNIFIGNLNDNVEIILESFAQNAVDKAIIKTAGEINYKVEDLVKVKTNAENMTTYIETDTIKINEYKSKISSAINKILSESEKREVGIKVFNLMGNTVLINRGPVFKIHIYPKGNVLSDIESKFTSAGVNQTMHELVMTVKIKTRVVFPLGSVNKEASVKVPLTNTVIVGNIPDSYIYLNSDESEIKSDILDLAN